MAKSAGREPAAGYTLESKRRRRAVTAPELDYRPPQPRAYRPGVGLIGCGGITKHHLRAYRKCGVRVLALCDIRREAAERRRSEFYPRAAVTADYREVLARPDIEVVDVATHPAPREQILADALRAGKHVLSQKPFVTDLDLGRRLVRQARRRGLRLAVNQNGRWAPHFAYLRRAVQAGLVGPLVCVDMTVHWNHNWVQGTPFDRIPHLLLYDFAIHWFDILHCFLPEQRPRRVAARLFRSPHQDARPPLLGDVLVEYPGLPASILLNGAARFGADDRTVIVGAKGTLVSQGPDINHQRVVWHGPQGTARPRLRGAWFTTGFEGTMGELLLAIEQDREPEHAAADNLRSLEIAFAAVASAEAGGEPVRPGTVRRLHPQWLGPS